MRTPAQRQVRSEAEAAEAARAAASEQVRALEAREAELRRGAASLAATAAGLQEELREERERATAAGEATRGEREEAASRLCEAEAELAAARQGEATLQARLRLLEQEREEHAAALRAVDVALADSATPLSIDAVKQQRAGVQARLVASATERRVQTQERGRLEAAHRRSRWADAHPPASPATVSPISVAAAAAAGAAARMREAYCEARTPGRAPASSPPGSSGLVSPTCISEAMTVADSPSALPDPKPAPRTPSQKENACQGAARATPGGAMLAYASVNTPAACSCGSRACRGLGSCR